MTRARISKRLVRLAAGNLGDVGGVGQSVEELREHFGPGYRIYFTRRGGEIIVLLAGGTKATQARDIVRACAMAKAIE